MKKKKSERKKKNFGALCINPFEGFARGSNPIQVPQVTMAMKTKKERFHVGALNRDLKGEMSRERRSSSRRRRGRRRETSPNSSILQAQDKSWGKEGGRGGMHAEKNQ